MSQVGALTCDQTFFFFFQTKREEGHLIAGYRYTVHFDSYDDFRTGFLNVVTVNSPLRSLHPNGRSYTRIMLLRRVVLWIIRVRWVIHLNEKIERIIRLTLSVCFSSNCNGL